MSLRLIFACVGVSLLLLLSHATADKPHREYRTPDGYGNNRDYPYYGKSMTVQRRIGVPTYNDSKLGLIDTNFWSSSVREISNIVFERDNVVSSLGATDFTTFWGQFLTHDIVRTLMTTGEYNISIEVPRCDIYFDPNCTSSPQPINLFRSYADDKITPNIRTPWNWNTAFIDASHTYGSDYPRQGEVRAWTGGRLKASEEGFPILNVQGFSMDNNAMIVNTSQLFLLGDVRGNENTGLATMHILFWREHNRWADEFAAKNPDWDDETLFQEARRMVIGVMQSITVNEYVPAIIGQAMPTYTGYNSSIDPVIDLIFSSAGFRYGHSEVNEYFLRLDEDRNPTPGGPIPLMNAFFEPTWIISEGLDPIVRGMAHQIQQEVDVSIVSGIRNFLFGRPGHGGLDLVSLNIMRARDHGIPDYNTIREIFGLERVKTWSDITSDLTIQAALAAVYPDVDHLDAYVAGLAEDHVPGGNVGPLFAAIYLEQMIRLRDGDRFWYQNNDQYTLEEIQMLDNTKLSDVILRNTNISRIQCFAMFFSPQLDCPHANTNTSDGGEVPGANDPFVFRVDLRLKTEAHPYFGEGITFGYTVDGVEGKELNMTRGRTYTFHVVSTCQHPMYLTTSANGGGPGALQTRTVNGITRTLTACGGSTLTITPDETTPSEIWYQCDFHLKLGWRINVRDVGEEPPSNGSGSGSASSDDVTNSACTVISSSYLIFAVTIFLAYLL